MHQSTNFLSRKITASLKWFRTTNDFFATFHLVLARLKIWTDAELEITCRPISNPEHF